MISPFTNLWEVVLASVQMIPFGLPPVQKTLKAILDAGNHAIAWIRKVGAYDMKSKAWVSRALRRHLKSAFRHPRRYLAGHQGHHGRHVPAAGKGPQGYREAYSSRIREAYAAANMGSPQSSYPSTRGQTGSCQMLSSRSSTGLPSRQPSSAWPSRAIIAWIFSEVLLAALAEDPGNDALLGQAEDGCLKGRPVEPLELLIGHEPVGPFVEGYEDRGDPIRVGAADALADRERGDPSRASPAFSAACTCRA